MEREIRSLKWVVITIALVAFLILSIRAAVQNAERDAEEEICQKYDYNC